jgi:hypothetical protein
MACFLWIMQTWWFKEFSESLDIPKPTNSTYQIYLAIIGLFFGSFTAASINTGPENSDLHVFFVCGSYISTYLNMFATSQNLYNIRNQYNIPTNPISYYLKIGSTAVFTLLWNYAIMEQNLYSGFVDYTAFACITVFYYSFIGDFY